MSVGAEQYQGSVNIRLEGINKCGETLRVLPFRIAARAADSEAANGE
jgi:hypothetical protein